MRTAWLVQARLAFLRFVTDARSLSGEVFSSNKRKKEEQSENIKYLVRGTVRSDWTKKHSVSVRTACNIDPRKDFSVDYMEKYEFNRFTNCKDVADIVMFDFLNII